MCETTDFDSSDKVTVTYTIKKVGEVAGDEVSQLYFRDNMASVVVYDKELCGFDRVTLQPGESKLISLEIDRETLSITNSKLERVFEPGEFTIMVGSSSEDIRLEETIELYTIIRYQFQLGNYLSFLVVAQFFMQSVSKYKKRWLHL